VACLADANILVYSVDPRHPEKQQRAREILERGAGDGSVVLPYQAIIEFVAAVSRPRAGTGPLISLPGAVHAADGFLQVFEVLYPTETILRVALGGTTVHQLAWYDACLWAYAEANGIPEILTEDFQHGRIYGHVQVVNPFRPGAQAQA
jgi:predicted nucleic acid-binding protein